MGRHIYKNSTTQRIDEWLTKRLHSFRGERQCRIIAVFGVFAHEMAMQVVSLSEGGQFVWTNWTNKPEPLMNKHMP